jgi:hypothetical protein
MIAGLIVLWNMVWIGLFHGQPAYYFFSFSFWSAIL